MRRRFLDIFRTTRKTNFGLTPILSRTCFNGSPRINGRSIVGLLSTMECASDGILLSISETMLARALIPVFLIPQTRHDFICRSVLQVCKTGILGPRPERALLQAVVS